MSRKRIKPKYKSGYVLSESGCELLGVPYEPDKRATFSDICKMKKKLELQGETMPEKQTNELKPLEQMLIAAVGQLVEAHGVPDTRKFIQDMINDFVFWENLAKAIDATKQETPLFITP